MRKNRISSNRTEVFSAPSKLCCTDRHVRMLSTFFRAQLLRELRLIYISKRSRTTSRNIGERAFKKPVASLFNWVKNVTGQKQIKYGRRNTKGAAGRSQKKPKPTRLWQNWIVNYGPGKKQKDMFEHRPRSHACATFVNIDVVRHFANFLERHVRHWSVCGIW